MFLALKFGEDEENGLLVFPKTNETGCCENPTALKNKNER